MAKNQTVKEEVEETTNSAEMAVMADTITDQDTGEIMSIAELVKSLDDKKQGMEVTSAYYEFPMGEEVKCFYVGDLKIKGSNNKEVDAVRILLPDGTFAITASAVVVSTFKQYNKMKSFSVRRIGEQKGPNGTYFTYKIFELV
jgi:hypothetical protein